VTAIPTNHRQLIPDGTREEFALVWGRRVRYLTAGTGPPLLLIPGLFGFSFSWSENISALAKHATVYAPDLLNTGYSDRAEIDTTLAGLADQVAAFMDAVGLSKADFVGSSQGGSIALTLAAKFRERVSRVILVSPSTPWSETHRLGVSLFSTRAGRAVAPGLRFVATSAVGLSVIRMYHDSSRIMPGTVEGYSAPLKDSASLRYLADVAHSWYGDFAELKTTIADIGILPILLIWGTHDRVVSLRTAEILQRHLRNARLVTLETGHLPYEELPEEFNRVVIDFLLRQQ
jgi:pimeloyl-ACP methyl ester carboxylesterase